MPQGIGRVTVWLCAASIGISYCDRVNMAVAVVAMSSIYKWTHAQQAAVLSAFFYGYVASQLLGSVFASRFGGRYVLFWASVIWSLSTLVTPEAAHVGLRTLLACRVILGLAEGMAFPSTYHIFGESSADERSRNIGALHAGGFVGTIVAFYVSEAVVYGTHWQYVFRLFGVLGLLWAVIWGQHVAWVTICSFPHDRILKEDEAIPTLIQHHEEEAPVPVRDKLGTNITFDLRDSKLYKVAWRLCIHRSVIPIFVGHVCHATAHFIALSWLPTYYHDITAARTNHTQSEIKFSSKAAVIAGPYACMAVFSVVAAYVADLLISRGMNRTRVRRLMGGGGYGLAAIFMLLFLSMTPEYHQSKAVLLTLALGSSAITAAGHEANKLDVAPPALIGLLQGISNTIAAFGGVVGIPFAAFLYERYHTWTSVFGMLAIIYIIGGVTALLFARSKRIPLVELI